MLTEQNPVGKRTKEDDLGEGEARDAAGECWHRFLHIRYPIGVAFALACHIFIFWALGTGHAVLGGSPFLSFVVLFAASMLLAYMEGIQVAILSVEICHVEHLRKAWPKAVALHEMVTKRNNVQRFLLGRQFLVIFVVFVLSRVTTFDTRLDTSWLPRWVIVGLLDTGFIGVMWTLIMGQLLCELVAASHPFHVMSMPGAYGVVQLCLFVEALGIVYFPWMITKLARKYLPSEKLPKIKPKECICECECDHGIKDDDDRCCSSMPTVQKVWRMFLHLRYIGSTALVCFALYITGYGFHHKLSTFPGGLAAHGVIFPALVILLGYLEGLKNALLSTCTLDFTSDPKWAREKPRGVKLQRYMISPRVIERFLVGRQFFTVFVMFIISRITAFDLSKEAQFLGWPRWLLTLFFECGLASGVMVVLVFGSLIPQLLASAYPMALLQLPGSNFVCYLSVFLANIGLVYMAWGGAKIIKCFLEPFEFPPPLVKHGSRTIKCVCKCSCGAPHVYGYLDAVEQVDRSDLDLLRNIEDDAWVGELDSLIKRGITADIVESARAVEGGPGLEPEHNFPGPAEFRRELEQTGKYVPHFLLPPGDPQHVPPHIVTIKLLFKYKEVDDQLRAAQRQGAVTGGQQGVQAQPAPFTLEA